VHSIPAGAALPIVGVILIWRYLHALPKRKADKSNQDNQSKKWEKPVRLLLIPKRLLQQYRPIGDIQLLPPTRRRRRPIGLQMGQSIPYRNAPIVPFSLTTTSIV
jgi:hypothetical protein